MRNMGKAITVLAKAQVRESHYYDDLAAFGAPGECYESVRKGEAARQRVAFRHAKSVSGLSRAAFNREIRKVSQRVMNKAISVAFDRYYGRVA